jgi:hypothetical protein
MQECQASNVCFSPVELGDIHSLVNMLHKSLRQCAESKIYVACASSKNPKLVTNTAFLLGAYLILGLEMDFDEVYAIFRPYENRFVRFTGSSTSNQDSFTVYDCWRALNRVRTLGWIDFSPDSDLSPPENLDQIDIDQYKHYIDPANGGLHIMVPGRLLFIPTPHDLEDDLEWVDVDNSRQFSPGFYADLLASEFDAALIINLLNEFPNTEYDTTKFERSGVAVEKLFLGESGDLLRAADRILALLRAAPGPVAVHSSGSGAGVLLATYLISQFRFEAGEAAAWLRISCPPLQVEQPRLRDIVRIRAAELVATIDNTVESPGNVSRSYSAPVSIATAQARAADAPGQWTDSGTHGSGLSRTISSPASA